MTGLACSEVRLPKKLEAELPLARSELRCHCLAGGLAQGPFLASFVCPELDSSRVFVLCFFGAADSGCIHSALVDKFLFGPSLACSCRA